MYTVQYDSDGVRVYNEEGVLVKTFDFFFEFCESDYYEQTPNNKEKVAV